MEAKDQLIIKEGSRAIGYPYEYLTSHKLWENAHVCKNRYFTCNTHVAWLYDPAMGFGKKN